VNPAEAWRNENCFQRVLSSPPKAGGKLSGFPLITVFFFYFLFVSLSIFLIATPHDACSPKAHLFPWRTLYFLRLLVTPGDTPVGTLLATR